MSTLSEVKAPTSTEQPATNEATTPPEIKTTFTSEEIQKLLPHRYPFLLVDKIIDYTPGKQAVGIKNVTINEPHFTWRFPR